MMRISFTISQSVNTEPLSIISKLNNKLVELGYIITYKDDKTIIFNKNYFKIVTRGKAFRQLDGGKFQIIPSEKESKLIFTYYFSFVPIIFLALFFIFFAIIADYHVLYILIVFVFLDLLRIDSVKSEGKQMINDILILRMI